MKKTNRIIILLTEFMLVFFILLLITLSDLAVYGIEQLKGQLTIVYAAEPVINSIHNKRYSEATRQKLILIQKIKRFAIDSLGVAPSNNYTTFYDQKNKPVLWVLTASERYALKPKEWTFPLVGSVSYKGFFNKATGIKQQQKLQLQGFDTDLVQVNAWSTLGWFPDPILSNQLSYSVGELAELIIHELTHGTIYIKNNVDFNENLASFIGNKGALLFLEQQYGKNSKEYTAYKTDKADELIFNTYVLKSTKQLDSLYTTLKGTVSESIKYKQKNKLIESIIVGVKILNLSDSKRYYRYIQRAQTMKNTFFLSFVRYNSQQNVFENELDNRFQSNLKQYFNFLKNKYH